MDFKVHNLLNLSNLSISNSAILLVSIEILSFSARTLSLIIYFFKIIHTFRLPLNSHIFVMLIFVKKIKNCSIEKS